jgi:replication fork clamp-binding protein CrfC
VVTEALNRVSDVEKRTLDKIDSLERRATDSAIVVATLQEQSARAASAAATNSQEAEKSANESKRLLASQSAVGANLGTDQLKNVVEDLTHSSDFAALVAQPIKSRIDALQSDLAAEERNIRDAVNRAFSQLVQIENSGSVFRNSEPLNNGGGYDASRASWPLRTWAGHCRRPTLQS